MENKWTWVDIIGVIAFVIMVCIACFQNSRIAEQHTQIVSLQEQIKQLEDSQNNAIHAQNDLVEVQKEQTAAILALDSKINRVKKK